MGCWEGNEKEEEGVKPPRGGAKATSYGQQEAGAAWLALLLPVVRAARQAGE